MLDSSSEGPYLRASSAQICPADSVTETAEPVSVTTARWPGSGPAVSHTRRCATPCLAVPIWYRQEGSSAITSPSGGTLSGEAGVRIRARSGRLVGGNEYS
jgi:hypothetical protein